jgi:VIT1/CCC1 family predicted Fe2+/Mn2+ transporter
MHSVRMDATSWGFPMHWQQTCAGRIVIGSHFAIGAVLPLLVVFLFPVHWLMWSVAISALLFLALLGSVAAYAGGASVTVAAARVTFWGALAMALTAGVGALFGVAA